MTLVDTVDCEAMLIRVLNAAGIAPASDEVGAPFPMLRVFTLGGPRTRFQTQEMLQLESWGLPRGSKADTRDLIEQALTVCYDLEGTTQPEGVVSWVQHDTGPGWLPDPTDRHPRYVATLTVYAHPNPGGI